MASDIVIVLTTVPDEPDAGGSGESAGRGLARALVEEGLAACVNLLPPMASVYRWKGTTAVDVERQVIIKTTRDHVAALQTRLAQLHPYELPELLVVPVTGGSEAYLDWIRAH